MAAPPLISAQASPEPTGTRTFAGRLGGELGPEVIDGSLRRLVGPSCPGVHGGLGAWKRRRAAGGWRRRRAEASRERGKGERLEKRKRPGRPMLASTWTADMARERSLVTVEKPAVATQGTCPSPMGTIELPVRVAVPPLAASPAALLTPSADAVQLRGRCSTGAFAERPTALLASPRLFRHGWPRCSSDKYARPAAFREGPSLKPSVLADCIARHR